MQNEEWKDIEGYDGLYMVSNYGNVKSLNYKRTGKECLLKPTNNTTGYYLFVVLCKNGVLKNYRVHRLVAQAFIPNPNNLPEVNHIDENKNNNCVGNLEWCTREYNNNYGTRNERHAKALSKHVLQIDKNSNKVIHEWDSATQVKLELGFAQSHICDCCKGKPSHKTAYGFIWRYA